MERFLRELVTCLCSNDSALGNDSVGFLWKCPFSLVLQLNKTWDMEYIPQSLYFFGFIGLTVHSENWSVPKVPSHVYAALGTD